MVSVRRDLADGRTLWARQATTLIQALLVGSVCHIDRMMLMGLAILLDISNDWRFSES